MGVGSFVKRIVCFRVGYKVLILLSSVYGLLFYFGCINLSNIGLSIYCNK